MGGPTQLSYETIASLHSLCPPPVLDLALDALELLLDDIEGLASLALLERLADARDDAQALLECGSRLLADLGAGFVEKSAALAVAENDPRDLDVCELVEAAGGPRSGQRVSRENGNAGPSDDILAA